uniref:Uncharacterized protein n=1 Tax=Chromera velia CCMP2878 TaxID=1169474 RepID=A0A0G4HLE9_9ALVE|eukprot:Cvel_28724.t1-p1 / transcript=Cvel_28724.t1 / gene=Cvel_28724 / organism=Chromera_velia_CCMP2878 / gene_product=hypothetical protein / transcript_product=hypothetical protein / location=Cvel_scaffold3813:1780-4666(-) / protein_length=290 / sequence_SO=supercontig / SO=protein_coding / is_pseudo=false
MLTSPLHFHLPQGTIDLGGGEDEVAEKTRVENVGHSYAMIRDTVALLITKSIEGDEDDWLLLPTPYERIHDLMEKDAEFYRKFLRAIEHVQSKLIKKRRNDPSEVKLQRKAALRSAFARIWRFQFPLSPILIANGQKVSQFIIKVDRGYAAERGFPRAHGFKSDPYKYANRQQGTYGFVGGSSVQPHTQTHWQSVPSTKGAGPLGLRGDGGDAEDPDSFGLLDSRERLDTSDSHLKDGNDAAFGGTAEIAPEGGKKRGKLPRKRPNYKNEVESQVTDKTTRPEETMMDKW